MWICSKCNEKCEDTFDSCWNCGMGRDGVQSKDTAAFQEPNLPAKKVATRQDEQTPMEFIQAVRTHSCYQALRSLVDGWFLLSIIATIVVGGLYLFNSISAGSTTISIIAIVATVIGCVLAMAVRQSSLLLIDIADTLIEQNRKKKNKEVSSKH